jgi:proline iminopeptidase
MGRLLRRRDGLPARQFGRERARPLSPDYSDQDIRRIWEGNAFATPYLLPELVAIDLTMTNKISVPLILFEGRHDRNVNSEVAATWFDSVKAPDKHLVWFEHSAHLPMTEEPGKFLLSLVRRARPIAEKAGDAAP